MSDSDLKAIGVAVAAYATALLLMVVALFVGFYAVGTEWTLDMPAIYLLQAGAWGIGVAWAGFHYRLSSASAWFMVAGGTGLVALIVLVTVRDPVVILSVGASIGVLTVALVMRLRGSGAVADDEAASIVVCSACGAPIKGTVCEECGTPVTPPVGNTIVAGALLRPRIALGVLAGFVLAPVAIVQYVLSPEGQDDALLIGAILIVPFVIAGLAWYGYRRWYRRRYPDE